MNNYANQPAITMKQMLKNAVFVDSDNIAEYAAYTVTNMLRTGAISGKLGNI